MPVRFLRNLTTSRKFNNCDWRTQSFYVRLINLVDDFGRYEADPLILRAHAFPLREDVSKDQVSAMCQELGEQKLVVLYSAADKTYLQITNWQDRPRSKSKFPEPPCEQLQTVASNCYPPSPSPSPSPSPAVFGSSVPVELPPGFPRTDGEAVSLSFNCTAPHEFVRLTWNKAAGRGGCDSKGVPIRSWSHHVATEWVYEQDRLARQKNTTRTVPGKPTRTIIDREMDAVDRAIAKL